jgi:hypothetical protein
MGLLSNRDGRIIRTVEASCDSVAGIVHYMTVMQRIRNALLNPAWVAFLWVGMSVGITMIATPARFGAASVTRAIALDVSRDVFAALNKAELVALVILLITVRVSGQATRLWGLCGAVALIVIAQSVWLIPELSARTDLIMDGVVPPKSYVHAIYSSLELFKIGLLLFAGFTSLERRPSDLRSGSG